MKPTPEMNYKLEANIAKRWSPRAFSPQPVTEAEAMTLFEAARWAASCMNEQPWRFVWSLKNSSETYLHLLACLNPSNREWAQHAPLLILTLVKTTFPNGRNNPWAWHDLGLAIGNLTLQAGSMEMFVHNMGGFDAHKARELFFLPEDLEPVTMIAVGYLGDPAMLSEYNQKRELEVQQRVALTDLFL